MKILKRIALGAMLVLVVAAAGGYGYIRHIAQRGVPDYTGRVELRGLKAPVDIFRDDFAIPHIYAKHEPDLYRAIGWCMAQDRLFQMDLIRRATTGRLSEVIGEKTVEVDHLMRTLNMSGKSERMMANSEAASLAGMDAFSDGVNQYIEAHRGRLPVEFAILGYEPEPWKPIHSFNVAGFMAFDLSTGWKTEIFFHKVMEKLGNEMAGKILPGMAGNASVIYPEVAGNLPDMGAKSLLSQAAVIGELGLATFSGSNNWAVSGAKSENHLPILANDMHLGLNAPGIWYQMHQVLEDEFNITGVVVPGQPHVTAGHNDHLAWGFTNVMVDDMDFYLEKINPENPNQYEVNGTWRDMKVRKEKIRVKGGRVVEKTLRFTHRGPIVSSLKKLEKTAISMSWTGNADSNESRSLYLLTRAENWEDFKHAMKSFRAVSQNVAYADTAGNIGLYCCAGVPIREKGAGISVMPGWTDAYDWKGFVPFDQLPHSYNPPKGFVCSANNRTTDGNYPFYISNWFAPDYRFRRIEEMLTGKARLSTDDFRKMHGDWKSKMVEDMLPDLLEILQQAAELTPLEKQGLALLERWDGVLTPESSATSIFEMFYLKLLPHLFADELGAELFDEFLVQGYVADLAVARLWKDRSSIWFDNTATGTVRETFAQVVRQSHADAVLALKAQLGDDPGDWQWGKLHQLTLKHPLGSVKVLDRLFDLNRGPYPAGGSSHTVSPYKYPYTDPFAVNHGASHRHIFTPDDWDASLTVIPTGTCGVPASPHYCDQTELYMANRYHADPFSKAKVVEHSQYRMTLVPGSSGSAP
ncbi:MAG: penicillin acylase family protein [Desulfobacterales bacterium]|nr:penicillin acylase family protein [Desulfobacterales bacterium]